MAYFYVIDGDNGLRFQSTAAGDLIKDNLIYECRLSVDGMPVCKNVKSEGGYSQEFRPYHLVVGVTLQMVFERIKELGWSATIVPGKFAPQSAGMPAF